MRNATDVLKIVFLCLLLLVISCKPVIRSFTVSPLTTTSLDSIKVTWDVSGTPTLLIDESPVVQEVEPHGQEAQKYLELTLVVRKRSKEVKRMVQVVILPGESTDLITFSNTLSANGDTLIANGEKNKMRWGDKFQIWTIASNSDRHLYVKHFGRKVELNNDGSSSGILEGTPLEGHWEIRSLITDAEKKDMHTAPESLSVKVIIQYKKR